MNNIKILDCTLRDGGYVNDFAFGQNQIIDIVSKLSHSFIDIIECGFLQNDANDLNKSLYNSVEALENIIGEKKGNTLYVAMIQLGKIFNEEIAVCNGRSIDGIRVTFHEHEIDGAFILGQQLMDKGYKVFMQPVGTTTYSDQALLKLIFKINEMKPYAFYLVDTLGVLYKNDLLRMFYLVDHNLDKDICIGFHSHNNLQLSFSNAQELFLINTKRQLIIDTSVLGMGRGAGNLCTELLTQFVNQNIEKRYEIMPVLEIIDEYIEPIYTKYKWGYSIPYYLASVYNCHPDYASYFLDKQTLGVKDICHIIKNMLPQKSILYDKSYAEELYLSFQSKSIDDIQALVAIKELCGKQKVLLLAPGKSLVREECKINEYIRDYSPVVISINFVPDNFTIETAFISNTKRLKSFEKNSSNIVTICTSNIMIENALVVNYASFLNEEPVIVDNSGLMFLNILQKIGIRDVALAGFDGFNKEGSENFFSNSLDNTVNEDRLASMNKAISRKLEQLKMSLNLEFITSSKY